MSELPEYRETMSRLEGAKRATADGVEFWMAREIHRLLGYLVWDKFVPVVERAERALLHNGIDPQHHIAQTSKMVELGSGSQRRVPDLYLTRAACYLIAMNGDPSKPEIAAAQAYFLIQTRLREIDDGLTDDEKRLELRQKVSEAVKLVSGAAQVAGVRSKMQGIFHDQRYQGLYGMSLKDLKGLRGLTEKDQMLDRAGLLELSMHDFQMNLAADVIKNDKIDGEQRAIQTNLDVAKKVRKTVIESKGTIPERLPLEPPIKEIQKRVEKQKRLPPSDHSI